MLTKKTKETGQFWKINLIVKINFFIDKVCNEVFIRY